MENEIPSTFDNYQSRKLSRGLETKSETEYKGYIILLRCYPGSGITGKIIKLSNKGSRIILRQEGWTFYKPIDLLNKLKAYIDNYENNLIIKYNNHYKNK